MHGFHLSFQFLQHLFYLPVSSIAVVCVASDNGRRFRLISFISGFALNFMATLIEASIAHYGRFRRYTCHHHVGLSSNRLDCSSLHQLRQQKVLEPNLFVFTFTFYFTIVLKKISQSLIVFDEVFVAILWHYVPVSSIVVVIISSNNRRCLKTRRTQPTAFSSALSCNRFAGLKQVPLSRNVLN